MSPETICQKNTSPPITSAYFPSDLTAVNVRFQEANGRKEKQKDRVKNLKLDVLAEKINFSELCKPRDHIGAGDNPSETKHEGKCPSASVALITGSSKVPRTDGSTASRLCIEHRSRSDLASPAIVRFSSHVVPTLGSHPRGGGGQRREPAEKSLAT